MGFVETPSCLARERELLQGRARKLGVRVAGQLGVLEVHGPRMLVEWGWMRARVWVRAQAQMRVRAR